MSDKAVRWEIYQDSKNEWRARFKAGNGEIVAELSEGYIDKADANSAIDSMELEIIQRATGGLSVARARVPRLEV